MVNLRFENNQNNRYYCLVLSQDLLGDWVITKAWGGINKAQGRIMHLPCESQENALALIEKMSSLRIKRGYRQISESRMMDND